MLAMVSCMSSGPLAAAAAGGDPMSKFSVDGGDSGTGVDPGAGEVARAAMLERLREREANVMAAPALRYHNYLIGNH